MSHYLEWGDGLFDRLSEESSEYSLYGASDGNVDGLLNGRIGCLYDNF